MRVEILLTALRSIAESYPVTDEGEWMQSEARDALREYEAEAGAPVDYLTDAETWGPALNEAGWTFIKVCPEKSALLFNNTKAALREAIKKYIAEVDARRAERTPQPTDGAAVQR